jgi:hypothetical protein
MASRSGQEIGRNGGPWAPRPLRDRERAPGVDVEDEEVRVDAVDGRAEIVGIVGSARDEHGRRGGKRSPGAVGFPIVMFEGLDPSSVRTWISWPRLPSTSRIGTSG